MSRQQFRPRGDVMMRPEAVGLTYPRASREDQMRGGVAVVRICGPLEHRGGWWFDSYESILGRIEGALQQDDVTTVLLDIDSPGGEVSGLQEAVRKIRAMRAEYDKPVIAYANDEAYSAAYALACSADEIYLPEGGGVGSVGVLAELQDRTAMAEKAGVRVTVIRSGTRKAEGHPFIPITDDTIARVQSRVDDLADQFFALVCDVRPTSPKKLEALQGCCLFGQAAVDAGLADGIASFDQVLSAFISPESRFDIDPGLSVQTPIAAKSGEAEMKFAVLNKAVSTALAALTAAKSTAERTKAAAVYAKAVAALTEAKVKKTYEKKTTETETEEDDGEKDEEKAGASDDEEPDDSDDEDDAEEEKAETGKKAKASSGLAAFVKSITGQTSTAAAQRVLASMHDQALQHEANTAEIAKLKAAALETSRDALIGAGMTAGQIKPAQLAWAKKQSLATLKSYLEATPVMFSPRAPAMPGAEASEPATSDVPGPDGLSATEIKICEMTGVSHESYKKHRATIQGAPLPKVN